MKRLLILLIPVSIGWGQVNVTIETIPPGAVVTIDGSKVGETPINDLSLASGFHVFRITLDRYSPIRYETHLLAAEKATLRFRLKERFKVKFISEVPEYRYRFDNKYEWFQEKMKFEMEAGRHSLEIFKGDSLIDKKSILIDQATTIHYQLK
ncbi:MAG: PEGA domain-containing protein [FCB group bacterium]|nr:PEGA domain-containing protein [FCB group bacterium]